jgi:hypothetical protein
MGREHFHRLRRLVVKGATVLVVENHSQRATPEHVAVDLHFGEGVTELLHGSRCRFVDEHLFGLRLRRYVVDEGNPFIEVVSAPGLDVAAHAVLRHSLPFQAGDEFARHRDQVSESVRERLAWRLLHRKSLHVASTDHQVIAVAVNGRISHEVIEVGIRCRGRCGAQHGGVVVHELPEEAKCVRLRQSMQAEIGQLRLEGLGPVMKG